MKVGSVLLENPVATLQICKSEFNLSPWYSTQLRALQSHVFSYFTGDYHNHVLLYLGNNRVLHTRGGYAGIDQLDDTFAPGFLEGCTILSPHITNIVAKLRELGLVEDSVKDEEEVWKDYWEKRLLPAFMDTVGAKTDVIGICLTPWRRLSPSPSTSLSTSTSASTSEEDALAPTATATATGRSYTCTGLIAHTWAMCGLDLFEDMHLSTDAIYPSDFIRCPYLCKN